MSQLSDLRARVADLEANFESRVSSRVSLTIAAMAIAPGDYSGKTDDGIRAAAVAIALGPGSIDGKDPDQICAHFDHLAENAGMDPVRTALMSRVH